MNRLIEEIKYKYSVFERELSVAEKRREGHLSQLSQDVSRYLLKITIF